MIPFIVPIVSFVFSLFKSTPSEGTVKGIGSSISFLAIAGGIAFLGFRIYTNHIETVKNNIMQIERMSHIIDTQQGIIDAQKASMELQKKLNEVNIVVVKELIATRGSFKLTEKSINDAWSKYKDPPEEKPNEQPKCYLSNEPADPRLPAFLGGMRGEGGNKGN